MAKQLDCTTSITSTQNNGIHGFHFGQNMTFHRLNHLGSNRQLGKVDNWGGCWSTSKSNHSNQQMPCEYSSVNSPLNSALIVALKTILTSSQHVTAGIISNVHCSLWHVAHFRRCSMLNWWASGTQQAAKYSARWSLAFGGGICSVSFLHEGRLCWAFVHPTRLTGRIFQAISIPGRCISELVMFRTISATSPYSVPGYSSSLSPAPQRVPQILTSDAIPQLEQCCTLPGILTALVPAWNGMALMDSRDNVIIFWLGLGLSRTNHGCSILI